MDIEWIREKVASGQYLWSLHADQERRNDNLEISDVALALTRGKILEEYPKNPRGAFCLVYGSVGNTPVHVVCGRNKAEQLVIITVYVPTLPKWPTPTTRSIK